MRKDLHISTCVGVCVCRGVCVCVCVCVEGLYRVMLSLLGIIIYLEVRIGDRQLKECLRGKPP